MTKKAMSRAQEKVLRHLLLRPSHEQFGYLIAADTGLATGTVYPILGRLERERYVVGRWETAQVTGRPRRKVYRLTSVGEARAREELAQL